MHDLSLSVVKRGPHYVVSWCELGVWAGILEGNGQVLKTLTERTEPFEHLTVSSPGVNWDFRSESSGK